MLSGIVAEREHGASDTYGTSCERDYIDLEPKGIKNLEKTIRKQLRIEELKFLPPMIVEPLKVKL